MMITSSGIKIRRKEREKVKKISQKKKKYSWKTSDQRKEAYSIILSSCINYCIKRLHCQKKSSIQFTNTLVKEREACALQVQNAENPRYVLPQLSNI